MDRNQQRQGQFGGSQRPQGERSQPRRQAYQQGGGSQQQGARSSQQGGPSYQQGSAQRQSRSRQQSQQGEQAPFGAQHIQSMTEMAVRGAALLWDLQWETARNIWRTQARTAAMLGIPDYSELFRIGDDRARRIFSTGAEQVLSSVRQASDTVVEMQRQIGRLAEQQTIGLTEEVREQIEQIGRQSEEGLQEIQQMTQAQAEQIEEATQQAIGWRDDEEAPQDRQRSTAQRGEASPSEPGESGSLWHPPGAEGGQEDLGAASEAPSANEAAPPAANEGAPAAQARKRPRGRRKS